MPLYSALPLRLHRILPQPLGMSLLVLKTRERNPIPSSQGSCDRQIFHTGVKLMLMWYPVVRALSLGPVLTPGPLGRAAEVGQNTQSQESRLLDKPPRTPLVSWYCPLKLWSASQPAAP